MYIFLWGLRKQVRNWRNLWNSGDGLSFGGGQHLGCSLKVGWWFRLFTWDGLNEPGIDLIWSDGLRKNMARLIIGYHHEMYSPLFVPVILVHTAKNHPFITVLADIRSSSPNHFLDNPKIFRFWWFNSHKINYINPIIDNIFDGNSIQ